MMGKQGWAARTAATLRRVVDFLQQAAISLSSFNGSHTDTPDSSRAFGVAITALAGLVIAAALGGTLLFSRSHRKRKRSPLTSEQWCAAFDAVSGRLVNQCKILETIRFGGIDPSIRTEVWPFLLGFYELDNTREERESVKRRKREMYIALKLRCNAFRGGVSEAASECDNSNGSTEVSSEGSSSSPDEQRNAALTPDSFGSGSIEESEDHPKKDPAKMEFAPPNEKDRKAALATDDVSFSGNSNEEKKEAGDLPQTECDNSNGSTEVSFEGSSSSPDEQRNAGLTTDIFGCGSIEESEDHPKKGPAKKELAPPNEKERKAALATDNASFSSNSNEEKKEVGDLPQTEGASVLSEGAHADLQNDCLKATDEFINWQRIIRVDAVRMNAEWVPYSPSQANVTEDQAFELAKTVGLKDDEHLEPCMQHHAARLVAILEAYALHDPETGYCQGMSDFLSPFVALLDEDYEAFWCFVQFMGTARDNFRTDGVGICQQLNKISSIFRVGDPRLYSHLESINAGNCYFTYRMVLVLLRRELTFEQTISLWEVIWAEKRAMSLSHTNTRQKITRKTFVTEDLILFVIAAAVRQRRKVIIENCRDVSDIIQECNSMAGHLDVWKLLNDAREIAYRVRGQLSDA